MILLKQRGFIKRISSANWISKTAVIICLSTILFPQVATKFQLPFNLQHQKSISSSDTSQPGLLSNVISEIRLQGDTSWVWLGTGRGLSRVKDSLQCGNILYKFRTDEWFKYGRIFSLKEVFLLLQ